MHLVVDGVIFEMQRRGGISRTFNEILPRLCEHGIDATLCVSGTTVQTIPRHRRLDKIGLPAYRRLIRPERWWFRMHAQTRRLLLQRVLGNLTGSIWQSTYYTLPPRGWEGPAVVFVYDMIHELFPQRFSKPIDRFVPAQKKRSVETADAIVCISETTRSDLLGVYDLGNVPTHVVHLAASKAFRPGRPIFAENDVMRRPYFLYVGERGRYKNFELLLSAFRDWSGGREFDLRVVGPPLNMHESKTIAALGVTERIIVDDVADDENLARLYGSATALIYPSLYEGFGLPLVEAMACDCPVVAADIPSSREVAGNSAQYFEPHDQDSLVSALEAILRTGRSPHAKAARQARANRFSWDRTAAQLMDVYGSVT